MHSYVTIEGCGVAGFIPSKKDEGFVRSAAAAQIADGWWL